MVIKCFVYKVQINNKMEVQTDKITGLQIQEAELN